MKKKITYLLGAGASFETLPLINTFEKVLTEYAKLIATYKFIEPTFPDYWKVRIDKGEIRKDFVNDLNWLIKGCQNHSSIDTFARKLFLRKQNKEYLLLKLLVSEFLVYQELINGIDKRYELFLATILDLDSNGSLILPDNIRILSWNYDKQLEFALGQFTESKKSEEIEKMIQLYPRKDSVEYESGFGLFKLNGSVGGFIEGEKFSSMSFEMDIIKDKIDSKTKDNILNNSFFRYDKMKTAYEQYPFESSGNSYSINYSWENEQVVLDTRNNAIEAIRDTDILVVIGYSFPTFNRKTDSLLLNSMEELLTVYVQSPKDTVEGVIQRIGALENLDQAIKVVPMTNVEEFYIPFEFN